MNNSSSASSEKKWLYFAVAIAAALVAIVLRGFLAKTGDVFELEAKIPYFNQIIQFVAALLGLAVFLVIIKNKTTSVFLDEVMSELKKVVWPDGQGNIRHTFGIIVGVTIVGFFLGLFDFGISQLLNLIYK